MAKKSLNNPNKPAVKTRSVITKQGTKVAVQSSKKMGTVFTESGKPALDKKGNQSESTYTIKDFAKNRPATVAETKKALRTGRTVYAGTASTTAKKKRGGTK